MYIINKRVTISLLTYILQSSSFEISVLKRTINYSQLNTFANEDVFLAVLVCLSVGKFSGTVDNSTGNR